MNDPRHRGLPELLLKAYDKSCLHLFVAMNESIVAAVKLMARKQLLSRQVSLFRNSIAFGNFYDLGITSFLGNVRRHTLGLIEVAKQSLTL